MEKITALVIAMTLFGSAARALDISTSEVSSDIALAQAAATSLPSGSWAGRLDLTPDFSVGGWQSLKSADEAYGVSKRLWSLQKGGQPLINIGLFAGVDKPLVPLAGSPVRFLAGDVVQVPGSTLDWALGTKWGEAWAPRLKTGVLFAHDLSRLSKTHLFGDFIGIGVSYGLGSPN